MINLIREARTDEACRTVARDLLLSKGYGEDRIRRALRRRYRIVVASPDPCRGTRVRERRVSVDAEDLSWRALVAGKWIYHCEHGGSVANAYAYRAETSTLLAVAAPTGDVVIWYGSRIPANKATLAGAANACVSGSGALWDNRSKVGGARASAAKKILIDAHARALCGGDK